MLNFIKRFFRRRNCSCIEVENHLDTQEQPSAENPHITLLNKGNCKQYAPINNIVAMSYASPGAMGCGGRVICVTADGNTFSFNLCFTDMSWQEVDEVCPVFKEFMLNFDKGLTAPDGWTGIYMGLGNFLALHPSVEAQFKAMADRLNITEPDDFYVNWYMMIKEIVQINKQIK